LRGFDSQSVVETIRRGLRFLLPPKKPRMGTSGARKRERGIGTVVNLPSPVAQRGSLIVVPTG